MIIGYARVSTEEQNLDLQRDALNKAGCGRIFQDRLSGVAVKRQGLDKALSLVGPGDVLTVWRLDRLGRSLPHLIEVIRLLGEKGAGFRPLSESIDTTTAAGRLFFHMAGAFAEFERSLIQERTRAGLNAARGRGVRFGRPKALTIAQLLHAKALIDGGARPEDVARSLKVGRSTLYRELKEANGEGLSRSKSKSAAIA